MTLAAVQVPDAPQPHPFSWDEYYRLTDLGFFKDKQVDLVEGRIFEQPPSGAQPPRPHRFSRTEYYWMADRGFFQGRRVELIAGEIIDMAAQKDLHVAATLLVEAALRRVFPDVLVRTQMPLDLGRDTDPEPDISVVPGTARDYVGTGHPKSALLVVEVADTSLRYGRGVKAAMYAAAGIADYWIIDLVDNVVEVRRGPIADTAALMGHRYQFAALFRPPQTVSPLARAEIVIPVADLLP